MHSSATSADDTEAGPLRLRYTFALSFAVLLCLAAGVVTVTAIEVASPLGRRPPTLSLAIGEREQSSVYGDYSWRGAIGDAFQSVAPKEPLQVQSHFLATLNLATRLGPPTEASCQLLRIVPRKCSFGIESEFTCWWEQTIAAECPPLTGADKTTLEFNVPPGRYVLAVKTWWDNAGGTAQNFSIEVK